MAKKSTSNASAKVSVNVNELKDFLKHQCSLLYMDRNDVQVSSNKQLA